MLGRDIVKILRISVVSLGVMCWLHCWVYAQTPIDLSIPNSSGDQFSMVTIPINVGDLTGSNVIAYQTTITFDENVLDAVGASSSGTLTEAFGPPTVNSSIDGQITVGGFGTTALSGSGTLVNLSFDVVGPLSSTTDLDFSSFVFNSGTPPANTLGGTFTVSGVVPVELSSFSVEVTPNSVKLIWSTESETNNFGFNVEKSANGKDFLKIGFVPGRGTTSIPQQYEFHDKVIQPGIFFYRLKQIDTDGSFEYSAILKVKINIPEEFTVAQNYPNPFNVETIIEFTLSSASQVVLKILNLNGEEIKTILDEPRSAGLHQIRWDGKNHDNKLAPSGIYIYELKAGNLRKSNKMILLK